MKNKIILLISVMAIVSMIMLGGCKQDETSPIQQE